MWFFKYKIDGYNDYNGGFFSEEGLIYGTDFVDATTKLQSWYGKDIVTLNIECILDENEPYVFENKKTDKVE